MQWNSVVQHLLAWTQNPISYILSQCVLAHSPVLHSVLSIQQIALAVAWVLLHCCSISMSLNWIICRFFRSLNYKYKEFKVCWGKIKIWRKIFQNKNGVIEMRKELEDDNIDDITKTIIKEDNKLKLHLFPLILFLTGSFLPVRLGNIFWVSESRWNVKTKKADSVPILANFYTWPISHKDKSKQRKVWNVVHSRQKLKSFKMKAWSTRDY